VPRKRELTFQSGTSGRSGRWRKKYRGKCYYFPAGHGKTDLVAYQLAVDEWYRKKQEIDAQAVVPYEGDYRNAIAEWTAVLNWSTMYGDHAHATTARRKIPELTTRLHGPNPKPLSHGDRICDVFTLSQEMVNEIALAANSDGINVEELDMPFKLPSVIVPDAQIGDEFAMTKDRLSALKWQDRIQSLQNLQTQEQPATVGANFERFKKQKQSQVSVNELSAGRFANLSAMLSVFCNFVGAENHVSVINEGVLTNFRTDLLDRVAAQEFSRTHAKDRLDAAKQFVRWLWLERILEDLPRVIEDRQFNISSNSAEIKVFTKNEILKLIEGAQGQLRLHILLGLNAALTQKDISDLKPGEVQWNEGLVRRKRSKTSKGENVPEVTYKLWPMTLELLKEFRTKDNDRVLLNKNGKPLKMEGLNSDGSLKKVDSILSSFSRLCRRLKIEGRSFTCLKKTSATLLRNNATFSGIESYFLGHAPRSMSDKHYSGGPDALLAEALQWLAGELEIDE
jgi:integrase